MNEAGKMEVEVERGMTDGSQSEMKGYDEAERWIHESLLDEDIQSSLCSSDLPPAARYGNKCRGALFFCPYNNQLLHPHT